MRDTVNVERRYPALSTIAVIIKIIAVLIAIGGVISAVVAFKTGAVGQALGIGLATAIIVLLNWAVAESISVLVDIEANTRASALAAQRPIPSERIEPT
jgi:magnesium-transporting ATPase (P-type)